MITYTKAHIIDNSNKSIELLPNGVDRKLFPTHPSSTTFLQSDNNFISDIGTVGSFNVSFISGTPISIDCTQSIPLFLSGPFLVVWYPTS